MKKIKEHPSRHTYTLNIKGRRIQRLTSVTPFGSEYCFFLYLENALRRYFFLTLFVEII